MQREFDVALSFAGEERQHAKTLADLLKAGGYRVFYDEFEQANLWGKDLYGYLSSVYKDKARYSVVFLSKNYARKVWPRHELRSAAARALRESSEYVLPVRIDDTEIEEILPTVMYLDLRDMSIEEVYKALVQKLPGPTLPASIDKPTVASVQNDFNDYVFIWTRDGRQYFIPLQNALWNSSEISLALLPETTEDAAFLRSLRNNSNRGFDRDVFPLALHDDAAWVSPQEVIQSSYGSQTVWKVVLRNVDDDQPYSPFDEFAIGNVSVDQIAEMRARRILLNEKLMSDDPSSFPVNVYHHELLESSVRGSSLSRRETSIHVLESPFPNLYRDFGDSVDKFQKFARLVSVFFLKLSRTVEDILELEIKLLSSEQLRVRFKGCRHQHYANVQPATITVDGICQLINQ